MPRKLRVSKLRGSPEAAWREWFADGFDLAGNLLPFGLDDDDRSPEGAARFEAAARAAWAAHGRAFLATWRPTEHHPIPWALEKFGKPASRENAD
jgi:hypothetical protein